MLRSNKCILLVFISILCLDSFTSCKKNEVVTTGSNQGTNDPLVKLGLPLIPFNYSNQPLPGYFQSQSITEQNNTPNDNAVTDWGATLGRVLFYDKILSINNSVACAS